MSAVRLRFAPSPTGELHIGGAHTALFNWMLARNHSGSLILRLEDTDNVRSQASYAAGILESLRWLGIDWDEGPVIGGPLGPYCQSERLPVYQKYINQLLNNGCAYYCFCTAEELAREKETARQNKKDYHYSGRCKNLTPGEIDSLLAQGMHPTVRIKSPQAGITTVNDLIRGPINFDNNLSDDFIIVKADGWPTYNLAVVIDDHTMKISHVIRAEEHLSNTPKQILLYQALGFDLPQFAHVSMILAPDRKKLSKRHGATPIRELREQGYLPEALISYLAQLGSSGNDDAILTMDESIAGFSLENVSRSPAIYDIDKLTWLNNHFLSKSSNERIINDLADNPQVSAWIKQSGITYWNNVVGLLKSRAKTLLDLVAMADYFFNDIFEYDEKGVEKYFKAADTINYLNGLLLLTESAQSFSADELETEIRSLAAHNGLKAAQIIHPARLALTGRTATPGLFEIMELLGKDKCVTRLNRAIIFINKLEI
ncbi:MAG TPA: glutamate--tRNA ligase [Syntrophomonadaceae bacterium]|nr:glutamate--tRNA ligase [Syntrophomonadaceae bacterium]HNX29238.1 glutamate--tRNA ligase [Syntrophomonadaceae bacterium]HPR94560.1 glutamate--tRNA ligase [Syntrophomonadaceae bacterium]